MSLVAINRNGSLLAAEAVTAGRSVRVRTVPEAAGARARLTVVGLPLTEVILKDLSLPPMEPGERREAIRLQAGFHLPNVDPATVRWQVAEGERGIRLLLLATTSTVAGGVKCVVPEPLALVGLMLLRESLASDRNTLLVCLDERRVLTVMMAGAEIVLMREIPLPQGPRGDAADAADLVRDLRLACQAVYLREERRPLRPDRTLIFSSALPEVAARLTPELFGDVHWIAPEECLDLGDAGVEPGSGWVLAGLAAFHARGRRFRRWDLRPRAGHLRGALRRGLLWSLPLWPLAMALYYEGEWRQNQNQCAALDGRLHALAPRYRELSDLTSDVTAMTELAATAGVGIESPRRWHEILAVLEAARPPAVYLTVFSGRLSGVLLASGRSPDYERVTDYVQALSSSARLTDVALILSEARREGVEFQLSFRLRADGTDGPGAAAPATERP